ncbi:type II toxin-antitoxin system HipA family toxin [Pseudoduganella rivuli]|uniref:type II toxin-antitoxin system HipA family toxin n=1 Tax=Pseudoduganella rivuli TaxID=2666085 RepID=UPI0012B0F3F6|nr:type II toxin-antitoxin system HipA family toxin [Pseudoduganella rivuli]
MECHLEIYADAGWRDCAIVTVDDPRAGGVRGRATFEYELDYVFSAGPAPAPVSLVLPVNTELRQTEHWPSFLYDLVPQGNGRKYLLGQLRLADDAAADFALICAGAFNPIGCIRVREAVAYFEQHAGRHAASNVEHGLTLAQILDRGEPFVERMLVHSMLAAGTTGIQGAAPKFLLTQDRAGLWHADGALPDAEAANHVIVKLPRGKAEADRKVLRNEAAYMRVARELGLRTAGEITLHGDMLFIPRFDRTVSGGSVLRHHQESAASIAGIVGFDMRPSQFDVLHALRKVVTDPQAETLEFLKRDVLNLAMRNTDNHARNTAVQVRDGVVRLTPLFDFAPMYLDPEGIARASRWYHPQGGNELQHWRNVLAALDVGDAERAALREGLAAFAEEVARLDAVMHAAGVEDDIVTYLRPSIAGQLRQLQELGVAHG